MAAPSAFWDRLADRYAAQPLADPAAFEVKLAATQRLTHGDMDVFEFGCGTGSIALRHAPHVRYIRAIDFSTRMVEIARAKAEKAGISNVSFEKGGIESVNLAPESLDMVMAHSVLHLLEDKRAAIAKSYAALKPGGFFVTSTACMAEILPVIRFVAPLGKLVGLMPHLDVMTGLQLRTAIEEAGFAIQHQWQPSKKAALFIIARKPERLAR